MKKYKWVLESEKNKKLFKNKDKKPMEFRTREEARQYKKNLNGKWFVKKQEDKKPKTHVIMVLDKSGSMASIRKETIDHFNEQVDKIRKIAKDQDVSISLINFNEELQEKFWDVPLKQLKKLTLEDYLPSGMTALYDAIGLTALKGEKQFMDLKDENTAVLFVVLTDGYENSSKEFTSKWPTQLTSKLKSTWPQPSAWPSFPATSITIEMGKTGAQKLKELIDRLQATGKWTFTYLGATHDFLHQAQTIGIYAGNAGQFAADAQGMADATSLSLTSTGDYFASRDVGSTQVRNYYNPNK